MAWVDATDCVRMVGALERAFAETLRQRFAGTVADAVMEAAGAFYGNAVKLLPDVSPDSPWYGNLLCIVYEIGVWKELRQRELPLADISVLNQKALALMMRRSYSREETGQMRSALCSPAYVHRLSGFAHKNEHPDDWRLECVVPGGDDDFDVGMNIHACPVSLLCRRLDAGAFFPYLCINDYVVYGMLGIALRRTQTLAHGATHCDFRLTAMEQPVELIVADPLALAEFKNKTPLHESRGATLDYAIEKKLFLVAKLAHRLEVMPQKYGTDELLTGADIHLIEIIGDNSDVSVTDIARLFNVTKGAVSQKLKRLELIGLVRKSESPENRSRYSVTLTPKGVNAYHMHKQWHKRFDGGFKEYNDGFPVEKKEIVFDYLEKLEDFFSRMLDQGESSTGGEAGGTPE